MATRISEKDREAIRQIELLAQRFDAIANESDLTAANNRLLLQEAFAIQLLQRLEILDVNHHHPAHQPLPGPQLLAPDWRAFILAVTRVFPDRVPWNPVGLANHDHPDGVIDLQRLHQDARLRAMCQAEFCRWLAWMISVVSVEKLTDVGCSDEPTSHELAAVRQLYEQNPETQLKDIKVIINSGPKAQRAREIMRAEGLDQSRPRKRSH